LSLEQSQLALVQWLNKNGYNDVYDLSPLTGDAGFRQYYRFRFKQRSFLAVIAPPFYCNNQSFIDIAHCLMSANLKVPQIFNYDLNLGYFCIEDFGNNLLASQLSPTSVKTWYQKALSLLPDLSAISPTSNMLTFDADFIANELNIFSEWLVEHYLSISLTQAEQSMLESSFSLLSENMLQQPQVFMHRDFHSRNLMVLSDDTIGIIDFQDAVIGPITYDAVSLLRDCYIKWPAELVNDLFSGFVNQMNERYQLDVAHHTWQQWFDFSGMQRHLKASGIFARLLLRDKKPGYIKDIPLTLSYIVDIASQYPQLKELADFIEFKVLPEVKRKLA